MQFTAINTVAFADMTGANTLFSTAFQLSAGLGISVGAIALRIGQATTSSASAEAFPMAFLTVAAVAFLGIVDSWRLDPATGLHVTSRG